jgi:hypothetical protein
MSAIRHLPTAVLALAACFAPCWLLWGACIVALAVAFEHDLAQRYP